MSTTIVPTDLVTVTIDGIDVRVPKGTLLVEASKLIARDIPVYCYHTKLGPAGLCRICLVEIEGMPKLQIACNTPVADGMKVHTASDKSNDGRRAVMEFLLLNHPLDCPICDKGGECDLQDYAMAYGQGASRLADAKTAKPKAVDLGPTIVLDEERCIVCQRCVRFDDIITQEQSLRTDDRGAHTIIATASGQPYTSDFTGNVTELCPVGALTSKTYRFKSRPWDNHRTTTTCTQCGVGCAMHVDQRKDTILRTMCVETEDDAKSDGWLCDRGRYNVGFLGDERRIQSPLLRSGNDFVQIAWADAIALWAEALRKANGAAGVIGGGRLLNEEAYLLQHVFRNAGVRDIDWRAGRQRQASPGPNGGTHAELETANVIVTVGSPPSETAPVLDLRIRKAVSRNGALLLSVGTHAARSFVAQTHVAIDALLATIPESAKRVAFVWDGIDVPLGAAVADVMTAVAARGTAILGYVPGEQANARGAEALGCVPRDGSRDTNAMLTAARDGKLQTLAIFGANPALHHPDGALAAAALAAVPFLVVSDLFLTETAQHAHLVLPACTAFEKSGTTTDLAGDVAAVVASVKAPENVLADGDMLVLLAEALGIALPSADDMQAAIVTALASPVASRFADPTFCGAIAPSTARAGLTVRIDTAIFTGGGTLAHDARVAGLRARPTAALHPMTARALGFADGDPVDLTAGGTLRDLTVVLRDDVPANTVAILAGIPEARANRLVEGAPVTLTRAAAHAPQFSLGATGA